MSLPGNKNRQTGNRDLKLLYIFGCFVDVSHDNIPELKKKIYITLLLFCVSLAGFSQYESEPELYRFKKCASDTPKAMGYVNDFENLFTEEQRKILDSIIVLNERNTTVEIALVTFDTNMICLEDFNYFTLKIMNSWGVGKRETNNGIFIAISVGLQTIRIHNGVGVQGAITDEETTAIIEQVFFPYFQEGYYFEGTVEGIWSLINQLYE